MATYILSGGKLVDKRTGEALELDPKAPACAPLVLTADTLSEPVKSMADGRYYSSKAALRATYKPSGNPQGQSYIEVGNEKQPIASKPTRDPNKITESLHKAMARYERGERVNPS